MADITSRGDGPRESCRLVAPAAPFNPSRWPRHASLFPASCARIVTPNWRTDPQNPEAPLVPTPLANLSQQHSWPRPQGWHWRLVRQRAGRLLHAIAITTAFTLAPPLAYAADSRPSGLTLPPRNIYGVHLLVDHASGRGLEQLRWARHLVGRWGHIKTLFMNITADTPAPQPHWIDFVRTCYDMELVPVIRLAGVHRGDHWLKPEPDRPGDYASIAAAVKRVVAGLPRSDKCPLYIEVWNEPNLNVEWSNAPDAKEYADFFVQVAAAIRSIDDPRIRILNGALGTSPDFTDALCKANPRFIDAFDIWASHPYPMNRPPEFNHHDRKIKNAAQHTIDSYVLETAVLAKHGRPDVKVMITETGWDLGNDVFRKTEGHPIIDEAARADYVTRAFRDYWSKWPEIVAVFPFIFAGRGWERFEWVYPDSETNPDGSPTHPHLQYTAVAALAKPTDPTGAINGRLRIAKYALPIPGVSILAAPGKHTDTSTDAGAYYLAHLSSGRYNLRFARNGFKPARRDASVTPGANTVIDAELDPAAVGSLRGRITDGLSGRPLPDATLTFDPPSVEPARTDTQGRYGPVDLLPIAYSITLAAEGHQVVTLPGLVAAPGRAIALDIPLGPDRNPDWPNLLGNPSFEEGGGGGGQTGIALRYEPAAMGRCHLADDLVLTGRFSQAVGAADHLVTVRQITFYNTAKPKHQYVAAVWARAKDLESEGAALTLDFCDNDGRVLARTGPSQPVRGTSMTWQYMRLEATAPENAKRVSVNLNVAPGTGTAYFDDAYLAASPSPATQ
jgi:hypothetical protein